MSRTLFMAVMGILAVATATSAHHSFQAYYFEDQSVTISGTVREFRFVSPHAVLLVDVKDDDGRERTYAAEFASPTRLAAQGVTRDTLRPGDVVVVIGSPGRVASDYKLHLKSVQRPSDGWSWGGGRRR
jgi:hypothetical protein